MALLPLSAASKGAASGHDPFTVVIDAGHGGKDHGAIGAKASEKNINLGVALKLKRLIDKHLGDTKVVMTRDDDRFVTLQGRADIANKAEGDLFVSIHTNSVAKNAKNRASVKGASVYVLGSKSRENLAVAQRENSVMMLEDDYSTTYQGFDPTSPESYIAFELIQNQHMEHSLSAAKAIQDELVASAGRQNHGVRQAMFWVLVKTGMPAVLVELDFISNPTAERFLMSEAGQVQLAEAIFNGIKVYKTSYDREMAQIASGSDKPAREVKKINARFKDDKNKKEQKEQNNPTTEEKAAPATHAPAKDAIIYKVQFLVTNSRLNAGSPKLKGLTDTDVYREGKSYKYTVGATESLSEANKLLKQVKKKFPDAFVIKTRDGKRIK